MVNKWAKKQSDIFEGGKLEEESEESDEEVKDPNKLSWEQIREKREEEQKKREKDPTYKGVAQELRQLKRQEYLAGKKYDFENMG